jgi:hypothetical protein
MGSDNTLRQSYPTAIIQLAAVSFGVMRRRNGGFIQSTMQPCKQETKKNF